ncbi:MAG: hypothetical protein NUV80_07630 [Candidatus Berkelbacteria bacterium]|nr:hypothetical protein [Candidatus Berkelbacteria bacterium]MCR4308393.1 hypothetical protein [Candidatus Berkelbacteria bacterium]
MSIEIPVLLGVCPVCHQKGIGLDLDPLGYRKGLADSFVPESRYMLRDHLDKSGSTCKGVGRAPISIQTPEVT